MKQIYRSIISIILSVVLLVSMAPVGFSFGSDEGVEGDGSSVTNAPTKDDVDIEKSYDYNSGGSYGWRTYAFVITCREDGREVWRGFLQTSGDPTESIKDYDKWPEVKTKGENDAPMDKEHDFPEQLKLKVNEVLKGKTEDKRDVVFDFQLYGCIVAYDGTGSNKQIKNIYRKGADGRFSWTDATPPTTFAELEEIKTIMQNGYYPLGSTTKARWGSQSAYEKDPNAGTGVITYHAKRVNFWATSVAQTNMNNPELPGSYTNLAQGASWTSGEWVQLLKSEWIWNSEPFENTVLKGGWPAKSGWEKVATSFWTKETQNNIVSFYKSTKKPKVTVRFVDKSNNKVGSNITLTASSESVSRTDDVPAGYEFDKTRKVTYYVEGRNEEVAKNQSVTNSGKTVSYSFKIGDSDYAAAKPVTVTIPVFDVENGGQVTVRYVGADGAIVEEQRAPTLGTNVTVTVSISIPSGFTFPDDIEEDVNAIPVTYTDANGKTVSSARTAAATASQVTFKPNNPQYHYYVILHLKGSPPPKAPDELEPEASPGVVGDEIPISGVYTNTTAYFFNYDYGKELYIPSGTSNGDGNIQYPLSRLRRQLPLVYKGS